MRQIIHRHTEKKLLGLFGKDRVNVLLVNLELDGVVQK
ncbi:MAG: potassium-transporting ATPase subunit C [Spirochaetia bacterium]|nr:potassium-transporting ATPase subunit C [Spirochaetia bacterium]